MIDIKEDPKSDAFILTQTDKEGFHRQLTLTIQEMDYLVEQWLNICGIPVATLQPSQPWQNTRALMEKIEERFKEQKKLNNMKACESVKNKQIWKQYV